MGYVEQIFSRGSSPSSFARGYLDCLQEMLSKLDVAQIQEFIDTLIDARNREASIFFIGNGGSAATASHFANDIALGTKVGKPPFRAMSLCDNVSMITAIGNDLGYDQVYVKQLESLMRKGDVVVAISASGNSLNIIRAVEYANRHQGITFGLTGFDGGKIGKLVRYQIHVASSKGEYGPVEDIHIVIAHLVSNFIRLALIRDTGTKDIEGTEK